MKLRNKKTGEIGWLYCDHISVPKKMTVFSEDKDLSAHHWDYNSLAELNKEWEDYEEPEEYWYYDTTINGVEKITHLEDKEKDQEIGNYFETKEEAEKAVEKLKAWKRLKDKGFRFDSFDVANREVDNVICGQAYFKADNYDREEIEDDLDLLFGGEE